MWTGQIIQIKLQYLVYEANMVNEFNIMISFLIPYIG